MKTFLVATSTALFVTVMMVAHSHAGGIVGADSVHQEGRDTIATFDFSEEPMEVEGGGSDHDGGGADHDADSADFDDDY